jgi:hypothetical protein
MMMFETKGIKSIVKKMQDGEGNGSARFKV